MADTEDDPRGLPLPEPSTVLGRGGQSAARATVPESPDRRESASQGPPDGGIGAAPNALELPTVAISSDGSGQNALQRSQFLPGQLIAQRYKIIQFIGRGAMGEVYEVRDTSLNENVALKVLCSDISLNERAGERFKREIQLARRVTHPNVCRIFDVGYHCERYPEGTILEVTFFTMELLSGPTLSDRIHTTGRLSPLDALPLIEQLAAGMDAAHKAGIVHRDLKCGNIILVPGESGIRAVITDFGLARTSEQSEVDPGSISAADEIVGTPDYMSPEQVRAGTVTPASDIYSLGVVMYVMLTGELPFKGSTSRQRALMRLEQAPPSPRKYAPSLDSNWEAAILQCLAKDPEDRPQHATDVARIIRGKRINRNGKVASLPGSRSALVAIIAAIVLVSSLALVPAVRQKLWGGSIQPKVPESKQLAVLPFTAVNADEESLAFARGLGETLTARLTKLTEDHSLQVIPATEMRSNHVESLQQARREFGVNLGLEGSVERSGPMVRVTYHLIDAKNARQLRGETITRQASDAFALEDEVANSVARALEIQLATQGQSSLSPHRAAEPAAYDFYLQGRGYLQDFLKPENLESAITVFDHALELDGQYAPAYAGLGEAYWYRFETTRESAWVNKARGVCEKAVDVDAQSAQAHECLGMIYQGTGKYELAAQEFQRAFELEPTSDDAVRGLASAYASLGKPAEAEEAYRRSINLRPHYWRGYSMLGAFYFGQARYGEAAQMFQQVIALAPDNYRGYSNLGAVYVLEGRYSEAIPLFQRAGAIQPSADAYSNLATAYFHLRQFSEAARISAQAVELNDRDYVMWGNLADAEIRTPDKQADAAVAYKKAISLAEQELQVNPRDTRVLGNLADYYSMLGDKGPSLNYVQRALSLAPDDPAVRYNAAQVYEQLGDRDAAVQWLMKALNAGYPSTMVRDSPEMDNLRSDPRVKSRLHQ